MGDLGVIEHDGIVAATDAGQAEDVRAALGAPTETPVSEPEDRAPVPTPTPESEPGPVDAVKAKRSGNPRHDATARMLEATQQAKAAREEKAAIQKERDELAARIAALERSPAEAPRDRVPARAEPPAPVAEKFTFPAYDAYLAAHPEASYDDWQDAKLDAHGDWREAKAAQRIQAQQVEQDMRGHWDAHSERLAIAKQTKYPDFDQIVSRADAALAAVGITQFPPALQAAIVESGRSDDVLYALGTHPEDAIQLARESADLPATAATMLRRLLETSYLGAGAAQRQTGSAPPPRQSRSAPPPNPVGSTPHASSDAGVLDVDREIANYAKSQSTPHRRRLS